MSDLSRLTEALEGWWTNIDRGARPYEDEVAAEYALRLVVDGQDVWWCLTHSERVRPCPFDPAEPCQRVTARLIFPTQGEET